MIFVVPDVICIQVTMLQVRYALCSWCVKEFRKLAFVVKMFLLSLCMKMLFILYSVLTSFPEEKNHQSSQWFGFVCVFCCGFVVYFFVVFFCCFVLVFGFF